MHIIKCLLVLFIYRKNLVESADKSAGASPSHGPAPASTNSGSDQGLGTRKDAKAGSSSTAEPKTASTGTPGSGENPKKDGKTSRVASPEDTRTDKSANNTQLSASSPPAGGSATPKSRSQQPSSQPGARTGGSAQSGGGTTPPSNESSGTHTSSDGTSRQGSTASSQPNQQRSAQQTGKSQNTPTELQASAYPKNIKLFKADPSDATKTKELTTDEYKVKKMDNEHLYEFNEDVNCTLIKRDDKDVWTYDSSKSNSKYPKGFSFERFIFIYFNGCTDVYDKIDNEWVLCVSLRLYINKPDVVDSGQLDLASIPIYCAPT